MPIYIIIIAPGCFCWSLYLFTFRILSARSVAGINMLSITCYYSVCRIVLTFTETQFYSFFMLQYTMLTMPMNLFFLSVRQM